jgi:hypothetical protein
VSSEGETAMTRKTWTPVKSILELQTGDVVRGRFSGQVYIVSANYGNRVTAVDTADITNPPEWEVLRSQESK